MDSKVTILKNKSTIKNITTIIIHAQNTLSISESHVVRSNASNNGQFKLHIIQNILLTLIFSRILTNKSKPSVEQCKQYRTNSFFYACLNSLCLAIRSMGLKLQHAVEKNINIY